MRSETGLPIDVISTREEAELALESCAPLLAGGDRRALLFDIGGGSTEFAWVRLAARRPPGADRLRLAAGRRRHPGRTVRPAGLHAETASRRWSTTCAARLGAFESIHCIAHEIRDGGVRLLGTSGTVTTLAGVALGLPRYRRPLVDGTVLTSEAAIAGARRACGRWGGRGWRSIPASGRSGPISCCRAARCSPPSRGTGRRRRWSVADRGLREGMLLRMIRADRGAAPRCAGARRAPP